MARGRKEVVRRLIGYDLFRLSEAEINNRLDVAFFPDRIYALEYQVYDLFCDHILPQLKRHKLLEDFYMNINIIGKKRVMTKENREKFNTSGPFQKISLIDGKDRAICALKAYYDNKP